MDVLWRMVYYAGQYLVLLGKSKCMVQWVIEKGYGYGVLLEDGLLGGKFAVNCTIILVSAFFYLEIYICGHNSAHP